MKQNQYTVFKELDRKYVAGGFQESEGKTIVAQKRECIESLVSQSNPLVHDVMDRKITFAETYDSFSRSFRGYRRFLPHRHDTVSNERLENLGKIVPNVIHFKRRSLFAADNPIGCVIYSFLLSIIAGGLWAQTLTESGEKVSYNAFVSSDGQLFLSIGFALAGLVVGLAAMLKYRTRNAKQIHAREAAVYMDLNYGFYRSNDDRRWARLVEPAN